MAGRPPEELIERFVEDSFKLDSYGLSQKYKRAISTISEWRQHCRRHLGLVVGHGPRALTVEHGEAKFTIKQPAADAIERMEKAAIALRRSAEDLDIHETEAEWEFGDLPIMLLFWGDWQLGDESVIMETFLKDKELIINTPGLFFIGMGDYKSNLKRAPFKSSETDILPPGWQDMLVLRYAQELKGKALGWLTGCHDMFELRTDTDFVARIAELSEAKHLWHQATFNLLFPGAVYTGVARHKAGRESGLNTTNAQRALYENHGNPDIVALAHKHFAELHHKGKYDKTSETVWVRSGSYLWKGEYGQRLGTYWTEAVFPGIILMPDREKMLPFRDFKDGLSVLEKLRA